MRFKDELERNITIRLGYANAKIYKCDNDACPRPDCYRSEPSNKVDTFPCERPGCGGMMQVIRYGSDTFWRLRMSGGRERAALLGTHCVSDVPSR